MKKQHVWSALIMSAGVALLAGATTPAGAAPAAPAVAKKATGDRRAAFRRLAVDHLRSRSTAAAAAAAPVQASVDGDALTLLDPAGDETPADSHADIRQVLVGNAGGGALQFTMQVETYSNPLTDPAWTVGFTGAFWFVDTSGDNEPEAIVEIFNTGSGLAADVFDPAGTGTFVCDGNPSSNAVNKTYTVVVPQPGCFGDGKRPAVAGGFNYDLPSAANQAQDFAPNSGALVRFTRPAAGPEGGYAIVSRSAGFQRYGALPQPQSGSALTPSGRFSDYIGPNPVVATANARPFDPGLWSVTDNGEVSTQDGAEFYGDATALRLAKPIVGMAVLPDRSGYWLVASDGGIFSFGGAAFHGSTGGLRLTQPIVGMAATPTGLGYWLVASDGGIFSFGDAVFHGSTGNLRLVQPVVGMASGYQGQGYWLVARDGGIFSFGLPFYGSTGNVALQQPIVGMSPTRSGGGYRFIARDGGVFSFGDAEFWGSGAVAGRSDVVGLASA